MLKELLFSYLNDYVNSTRCGNKGEVFKFSDYYDITKRTELINLLGEYETVWNNDRTKRTNVSIKFIGVNSRGVALVGITKKKRNQA